MGHKFLQSFYWPKILILSKKINQIVLSSKNSLTKTLVIQEGIIWVLHCTIFLLLEIIVLLFFLTQEKWLRDRGSLVAKWSEHKGRVVLVWFRDCKRILQDSGNFKRVAWGLDVGTGRGRTSINWVCTFSSLKLLYLLLFIFCIKEV